MNISMHSDRFLSTHTHTHGLPSHMDMDAKTLSMAIIVMDGFSCFTYQSLLEPFLKFNELMGASTINISIASPEGGRIASSDGSTIKETCSLNDLEDLDVVVICGSDEQNEDEQLLMNWLRQPQIRRLNIGAVDSGCLSLMRSGLLDGYESTIHWRYAASAQTLFPDLTINETMLQFDRNRFTCCGGVVALKLAIELCRRYFGNNIAHDLATYFNYDLNRSGDEVQQKQLNSIAVEGHNQLNRAISYINKNLEDKIHLHEVARVSGVSKRQMERHFKNFLGITPAAYIQKMRLIRSLDLLKGTTMSVTQIAFECGFSSSSHFSTRFRHYFGQRPSEMRPIGLVRN